MAVSHRSSTDEWAACVVIVPTPAGLLPWRDRVTLRVGHLQKLTDYIGLLILIPLFV